MTRAQVFQHVTRHRAPGRVLERLAVALALVALVGVALIAAAVRGSL